MTQPKEHPILLVDDEPGILNAVRRELQSTPYGRHRFRVEAFSNPEEALECAQKQAFEVVISDYQMPIMDGLAFIKAFAKKQPDCIRIVMSGQTDRGALARMINETHIYRFIPKPWSSYFLKSSLAQAVDLYERNIESRRLVQTLVDHGILLPQKTTPPPGNILVIANTVNDGKQISRALTQHNAFSDLFHEVLAEAHACADELKQTELHVDIATTPQQALKLCEDTSFSCVIADYHSMGMDGAQFLVTFSEKYPDCKAIMISEETSMDSVILALDLAHLSAFITKPWSDFELYAAVAQAVTQYHANLGNRALAEMCLARGFDTAAG